LVRVGVEGEAGGAIVESEVYVPASKAHSMDPRTGRGMVRRRTASVRQSTALSIWPCCKLWVEEARSQSSMLRTPTERVMPWLKEIGPPGCDRASWRERRTGSGASRRWSSRRSGSVSCKNA
jgi:hypothetical protein